MKNIIFVFIFIFVSCDSFTPKEDIPSVGDVWERNQLGIKIYCYINSVSDETINFSVNSKFYSVCSNWVEEKNNFIYWYDKKYANYSYSNYLELIK